MRGPEVKRCVVCGEYDDGHHRDEDNYRVRCPYVAAELLAASPEFSLAVVDSYWCPDRELD